MESKERREWLEKREALQLTENVVGLSVEEAVARDAAAREFEAMQAAREYSPARTRARTWAGTWATGRRMVRSTGA